MTTIFSNGSGNPTVKPFQNVSVERFDWAALAEYFSKFGDKKFKASDLVDYFSTLDRVRLEDSVSNDAFPYDDVKLQEKLSLASMGPLPTSDKKLPAKPSLAAKGYIPTLDEMFPVKPSSAAMGYTPTFDDKFPVKPSSAAMGYTSTFDDKFPGKLNSSVGGKRPGIAKLEEYLHKDMKNLASEMCQQSLKEIEASSIAFQQVLTASKLSETVLFRVDTLMFLLRDISVKVVDNFVIIHAKHAEKIDDHGLVSREFTRKYKLPENIDPLSVKATYDRRGILAIHAEKKGDLRKEGKDVPVNIVDSPMFSSDILLG